MRWWILWFAVSGCAAVAPGDRNGGVGGGGGQDAGVTADLAEPTVDLAQPSIDLAQPTHDLASQPAHDLAIAPDLATAPQPSCVPRVNELMTGSSGQAT